MHISRKIATGAVPLVAMAALATAASPAGAATAGTPKSESVTTKISCNGWQNAGGIAGRWTKSKDPCSTWGHKGMKVRYRWAAERGTPCIKVKGFKWSKTKKNYVAKWYNAGCGKSGFIKNVPWGNVAAHPEIKIKGFSLLKWQ
ncbi:hypothetical protein JQK87_13470 [Streptomyces sp. G44]|uniref:hypothetical protein n=1 Tax=Streptomyces sp. G44 TaxID=2807632 RepID=UPI00196109CB|nr:hypothetical protein [Streptomyces sp. G44]MBM7169406.1 hypothetical protein [Streptomyces sp. G44]